MADKLNEIVGICHSRKMSREGREGDEGRQTLINNFDTDSTDFHGWFPVRGNL
jgi:hypothetical protein